MKIREGSPTYTFYDGPPTANGKPHIGHVETRAIKGVVPPFPPLKGVYGSQEGRMGHPRPAGGAGGGEEAGTGRQGSRLKQYGLEPFIEKCKESVWKYKGMWKDFSKTVGFWADMDESLCNL